MTHPNSSQNLENRARNFLCAHGGNRGAQLVLLLRRHPGRAFTLPEVCRLLSPHGGFYGDLEPLYKIAFQPIPAADAYAQAQYLRRRRQLLARIESGDAAPALKEELDALDRELRRITHRRGALKHAIPELDKAYHELYTAVWKLLRKAQRRDPELHRYLAERLSYGSQFCWREDSPAPSQLPTG